MFISDDTKPLISEMHCCLGSMQLKIILFAKEITFSEIKTRFVHFFLYQISMISVHRKNEFYLIKLFEIYLDFDL